MLTNAYIQAALSERQKARSERAELTGDMVIAELRTLAFANLGHYFDAQLAGNPKLLTLEQTAALQEATVDIVGHEGEGEGTVVVRRIKFKLAEKRPALV